MSQIRVTKNADLDEMLEFLAERYRGLSESEITKLALAELYNRELENILLDGHEFLGSEADADQEPGPVDPQELAEVGVLELSSTEEGPAGEPLTDPKEAADVMDDVYDINSVRKGLS